MKLKEYRRKPTIIQAVQWHPGVEVPGVRNHQAVAGEYQDLATFRTIHGQDTTIYDGTWLVLEDDGEHWYPVKDEIFRNIYIPLDPEEDFDE